MPKFHVSDKFKILGLQPTASLEEVDQQFKKLSQIHHPNTASTKELAKQYPKIVMAYDSIKKEIQKSLENEIIELEDQGNNHEMKLQSIIEERKKDRFMKRLKKQQENWKMYEENLLKKNSHVPDEMVLFGRLENILKESLRPMALQLQINILPQDIYTGGDGLFLFGVDSKCVQPENNDYLKPASNSIRYSSPWDSSESVVEFTEKRHDEKQTGSILQKESNEVSNANLFQAHESFCQFEIKQVKGSKIEEIAQQNDITDFNNNEQQKTVSDCPNSEMNIEEEEISIEQSNDMEFTLDSSIAYVETETVSVEETIVSPGDKLQTQSRVETSGKKRAETQDEQATNVLSTKDCDSTAEYRVFLTLEKVDQCATKRIQFNKNISHSNHFELKLGATIEPLKKDAKSNNILQEIKQAPTVEINLYVTLEEVLKGCKKQMKVTRTVLDSGDHQRVESRTVEVNISPGIEEGTRIVFEKEGDRKPGMIPADIVFIIREKPHPIFKRMNADLIYIKTLPLKAALCGDILMIPSLEGSTMKLKKAQIIHHNTTGKIARRGLPFADKPDKRGDIIVHFNIDFPKSLAGCNKNKLADLL